MITQRTDQLTYADIERLVEQKVPEGRELDYKRQLPGRTDKDINEFLKDVSSFANASGGHLVFGVTTTKEDGQNTNIPGQIEGVGPINAEVEVLRLEQMIRDGIQPRLVSFQVKLLTAADKPTVVVIHVPRSWNAPHVVGRMSPTFFSRTSTGKHPLDVTELRHAFAMSEAVGERIRAFRDERIGRILAGDPSVPVLSGPTVVLHMLPVRSFAERPTLDVRTIRAAVQGIQPMSEGSGWGVRNTFDGISIAARVGKEAAGHVIFFRSGAAEVVDTRLLRQCEENGDGKLILSQGFEEKLIETADNLFLAQKCLEVAPPVICFLSLLNVRGFICHSGLWRDPATHRIDRDHLLMSDVLVEDVDATADVFLRPALDVLWQSCGAEGSPFYGADGRWKL